MSSKKSKEKPVKQTQDTTTVNDKFNATIELVLQQHIIFWLLFFPPVAIYKIIKHKIFNKIVTSIIILLLICALCVSAYFVTHPSVVIDNHVSIKMEDLGYGTTRDVTYIGQYDENFMSEIITNTGYYVAYYHIDDNDEIVMDVILELSSGMNEHLMHNKFLVKYQSESANVLLTQVNPAIIKFLISNPDYGRIESIVDSTASLHEQELQTTKGLYRFKALYYETIKVQKYTDGVFVDVMNRDYTVKMKDEFIRILNQKKMIKQYYDIQDVIAYVITEEYIGYEFTNFCGNLYRIVKYNDGTFDLNGYADNPVAQEDLEELWNAYQESLKNG